MEWTFEFSRKASKFLEQHLPDTFASEAVFLALRKLSGEAVAVDLEVLHGSWKGSYRVRRQKVRVIFSFNATARLVLIEVVDFRDSAYRRRK
jgi:mRNA-degrading endonuclease RelE of RelBE toxin-antitoxin system